MCKEQILSLVLRGIAVLVLSLWELSCLYVRGAQQVSQPDMSKYVLTQPRILFTVPLYGGYTRGRPDEELAGLHFQLKEDTEPWTPPYLRFYLAPDGTFYIVDGTENGGYYIKQFDRSGRLRKAIPIDARLATASWWTDFAVDREGRLFFAGKVLDPEGKPLPALTSQLKSAREAASALAPTPDRHRVDSAGVRLVDDAGGVYYVSSVCIRVDPKTRSATYLPYFCFPRRDGFCFAIEPRFPAPEKVKIGTLRRYDQYGKLRYEVKTEVEGTEAILVYDPSGLLRRRLTVPRQPLGEIERLVPDRVGAIAVDARGHIYVLARPLVLRDVPVSADGKLYTTAYDTVLEYDDAGHFVGVRAIVPCWLMEPLVDEAGNVYWAEVEESEQGRQYLRLMMAPVPQNTR